MSLTVVRSVVTVSRFLFPFNKATNNRMKIAAPITHTQGCVYHVVLLSPLTCMLVVFVVEEEPDVLFPSV